MTINQRTISNNLLNYHTQIMIERFVFIKLKRNG